MRGQLEFTVLRSALRGRPAVCVVCLASSPLSGFVLSAPAFRSSSQVLMSPFMAATRSGSRRCCDERSPCSRAGIRRRQRDQIQQQA